MGVNHSFIQNLSIMAEQIVVTVYTVNGQDQGSGVSRTFPSKGFRSRAISGVKTSLNGTRLYGFIEEYPTGLGNKFNSYEVVQTPTELAALANAALA